MTLLYLALAWLLGLWLADAAWGRLLTCGQPAAALWLAGAAALLAVGVGLRRMGRRAIVPLSLLCFLLGGWRYTLSPSLPCFGVTDLAFYNGSDLSPRWLTLRGVVDDRPDVRDRLQQLRVRAQAIVVRGAAMPVQGVLLVQTTRYPVYRAGDLLELRGPLVTPPQDDAFSYRDYLARRGVFSLMRYPRVDVLAQGQGPVWRRALLALKARSEAALNRLLPEPHAALANGMLLGIESGIPPSVEDAFRATGTIHIIVISGSQVSLVTAALYLLARRTVGARRALLPATAGILVYTLLVGADPPVVRAAFMGFLFVLARHVGRPAASVPALAFAALVMTALNPLTLWDVSTQLSFAAVAGLVFIGAPLHDRLAAGVGARVASPFWREALAGWLGIMALTLGAQIMTAPLIAAVFGHLSLVSLPANFLVLPLQAPLLGGGAVALVLALMGLWPLAQWAAVVPWLALSVTHAVVGALAAAPAWSAGQASPLWALAAYGGISLWLWRGRVAAFLTPRRREWVANLSVLALAATVVAFGLNLPRLPNGRLTVRYLDVGEGAATLITTPDGRHVLVDGGPSPRELLAALGDALPVWERRLSLVVLTRSAGGHLDGLVPLLERYRVAQVLAREYGQDSRSYQAWQDALSARGIPVTDAVAGLRVDLGDGAVLDVLGDDVPGAPLALRLAWGDVQFLFAELDAAGEQRLVAQGWPLRSDVLRVARAGSDAATSGPFLAAVQPRHAIVSTGRGNPFGHPAPALLERLSATGAQVWRTDAQGTVVVVTDGVELWVRSGG